VGVNKINIVRSTNESTAKHRHENAGPWKANLQDKLSATKGNIELKMGNNQQNVFASESNSSTPRKRIPGIYYTGG
jgi:hypothetical protein